MKRKVVMSLMVALPIAFVAFAVLLGGSSTAPGLGFSVLSYTNDVSGVHALIQITNRSAADYSLYVVTQISTNGMWQRSASQPYSEEFIDILPAKCMVALRVAVPEESLRWRVECQLWQKMSKMERRVDGLLVRVGLRYPFHLHMKPTAPDGVVTSAEFAR